VADSRCTGNALGTGLCSQFADRVREIRRTLHVNGGGEPSILRILVVDNDPLVLNSMRTVLEFDGHAVAGANGGQEGLDLFSAAFADAEPFMLVITDLTMPGMDGLQLARAVKTLSPATPVILVTGWGAKPVHGADIDYVLGKPLRIQELRTVLKKCEAAGKS
jgi:CheY-like chemotaxis protein